MELSRQTGPDQLDIELLRSHSRLFAITPMGDLRFTQEDGTEITLTEMADHIEARDEIGLAYLEKMQPTVLEQQRANLIEEFMETYGTFLRLGFKLRLDRIGKDTGTWEAITSLGIDDPSEILRKVQEQDEDGVKILRAFLEDKTLLEEAKMRKLYPPSPREILRSVIDLVREEAAKLWT